MVYVHPGRAGGTVEVSAVAASGAGNFEPRSGLNVKEGRDIPCNCGGNANTQQVGTFEITYPTGGTRIVNDMTEVKVAMAANPQATWRKLPEAAQAV